MFATILWLFQAGKLSEEVNFMPQDIRNKLNELKRQEMNRLRKIVQAKSDLDNGKCIKLWLHLSCPYQG